MTAESSASTTYSTARGYLQAAKMIWESPHRTGPNVYAAFLPMHLLLGFAAELYLKAFLRNSGFTDSQLRAPQLRHDLKALLAAARRNSFPEDEWIDELINKLHVPHMQFDYRYSHTETIYDGSIVPIGFDVFDRLDFIVDDKVGASASLGLEPGH